MPFLFCSINGSHNSAREVQTQEVTLCQNCLPRDFQSRPTSKGQLPLLPRPMRILTTPSWLPPFMQFGDNLCVNINRMWFVFLIAVLSLLKGEKAWQGMMASMTLAFASCIPPLLQCQGKDITVLHVSSAVCMHHPEWLSQLSYQQNFNTLQISHLGWDLKKNLHPKIRVKWTAFFQCFCRWFICWRTLPELFSWNR